MKTPAIKIEIGMKLGCLIILAFSHKHNKHFYYTAKCVCGSVSEYRADKIRSGKFQDCDCQNRLCRAKPKKLNGLSKTREYKVWGKMIARCHNPNNYDFRNYGARGIFVCERWRESFLNFLEDMGKRPNDEYSIDRINNDDGYYPENCRWATRKVQNNNKRQRCSKKANFSCQN